MAALRSAPLPNLRSVVRCYDFRFLNPATSTLGLRLRRPGRLYSVMMRSHHPVDPRSMFLTRRDFLTRCTLGFGALGFGSLMHEAGGQSLNPLAPQPPSFRPKAKRVIHIFANGGPSHVDTFDPKPSLDEVARASRSRRPPADRAQDRRGVPVAVQVSRSTARAASRSASSSRTSRSASTTCASSARCTPTCRTTSRRCC